MSDREERSDELLAYLQGEIGVEDCRKLEKELLESDDLRQQLLELATEEAALIDWAKVEKSSRELDDEAFREDFMPSDSGLALPIPKRKQLTGWWVAAAVLVISAAGFFLLEAKSPSPEVVDGVAHLVSSVDAEWDGVTPVLNRPLAPEEYELTRGTVDLLFADGARVSVSGPARFDLRSARHIHLESGKLVASIPDEALGFIVTSPQSEVVDLGTEFGLSVDEAGLTDVHVMDGLVEVLPAERESSGQPLGVMISQGEARRFRSEKSTDSVSIPVSSRAGLIGPQSSGEIGLDMLRGSVRVVDRIAKDDLNDISEGPSWIDLVVEQRDVLLGEPLTVSIDAPGSYRNFVSPQATLPP
ncbi:MAG: FecR family protein, partial [Verrucomicrobiota bacterium]